MFNFRLLAIALGGLTAAAPMAASAQGSAGATSAEGAQARSAPATFGGPAQLDESKRTEAADRSRDASINELKEIIATIDPGDQRSELLFQLAELWIEKAKYVYFREFELYDQQYNAWTECVDTKGERACGAEPKVQNHQSELYRSEALNLYEQILKDSPTYPRKDEVLFALATNLYERGDREVAIERHRDLVTQYPRSRFVGDSYVAMGEHFFNGNELAKAEFAYEKALEASANEPRIYNFALYKLAWCSFNLGDYEKALTQFQEVVVRSEAGRNQNEVALKGEALNDMILTWQALDAVGEANTYYKSKTNKEGARRLFGRLADRYFSDARFDLAIQSYQLLIEEEPFHAQNPAYQSNIVRSYEGLRQRDRVLAEMKVLVDNYKPGSPWSVANQSNERALASAYDLSESAMRELVTDYHREAQNTKDVRTYRLAGNVYKEYLDSFADSEMAYSLRNRYADILWELEEWEQSAEQYELVYAADPEGNYAKSAAYNTLLAYEKLVAIEKGRLQRSQLRDDQKIDESKNRGTAAQAQRISTTTVDKNVKPEEIPHWEMKLLTAADRYAEIAAADPRLAADEINMRYTSAFIYYDRKHFTEAANRFGDIILKWPTDAQARKAADLSLNILEVKEEWSDLARLSRAFYENKQLAKPGEKWTQDLGRIMEGAQYKYIDLVVYQEEKRAEDAAGMFRDFVTEFPKSEYAAQALLYSMEIYNKANKIDQGMIVAEKILSDYPTSTHRPTALWSLAKFNEQTANFANATAYFLQYAREWEEKVGIRPDPAAPPRAKVTLKAPAEVVRAHPDDAVRASDALFNAALWTEGMGNFEEAVNLYREYIAKYSTVPNGVSAATLSFHIGEIYTLAKSWEQAEKAYDDFIKGYERQASAGEVFFARYRRARALDALGRTADANRLLEVCAKDFPGLAEADRGKVDYRDAYAFARFRLLEPQWKAYVAIKFDNPRRLQAALKQKVEATPKVEAAYTQIVEIGSGDWAVAALARIGQMYQDFARNLLDSPDPPELADDFELLDLYRAELENRAFPLEDKAIEAFELALEKSYELMIYNEFTLAAQDALNRFKPGEYGEIRQAEYTGSEFFSRASPALTVDATFGSSRLNTPQSAEASAGAEAESEDLDADEGSEAAEAAPEAAPEKKKGVLILNKPSAN